MSSRPASCPSLRARPQSRSSPPPRTWLVRLRHAIRPRRFSGGSRCIQGSDHSARPAASARRRRGDDHGRGERGRTRGRTLRRGRGAAGPARGRHDHAPGPTRSARR
jgi:hypothetical protein